MIQIDELVIRVPGTGNEESHHLLGKEVAQRVAEALPDETRGKQIAEMNIQLTAHTKISTIAIADLIAEHIIRQIGLLDL